MSRFDVVEEKTTIGRDIEKQYAIYDYQERRVFVRFSNQVKADLKCAELNEAHEMSRDS